MRTEEHEKEQGLWEATEEERREMKACWDVDAGWKEKDIAHLQTWLSRRPSGTRITRTALHAHRHTHTHHIMIMII